MLGCLFALFVVRLTMAQWMGRDHCKREEALFLLLWAYLVGLQALPLRLTDIREETGVACQPTSTSRLPLQLLRKQGVFFLRLTLGGIGGRQWLTPALFLVFLKVSLHWSMSLLKMHILGCTWICSLAGRLRNLESSQASRVIAIRPMEIWGAALSVEEPTPSVMQDLLWAQHWALKEGLLCCNDQMSM